MTGSGDLHVRELTDDDYPQTWRLGALTFGRPDAPQPDRPPPADGLAALGVFDGGRLVGKAVDLFHEQWWGGRLVPASGVAGVAIAPEARGRQVGRLVLTALLRQARDRGAAVAALFCTRADVYRSIGFETGGYMRYARLPTEALRQRRLPEGVRLRAGDGTDMPAVRGVYDEVARTGQGLLSRRGPLFDEDTSDGRLPEGLHGITLAEEGGVVTGYASWVRGEGYRDESVVTVEDLLALTPAAATALVAVLGTWSPVAPTLHLRLPPWMDAVTTALPLEQLREHRPEVWLHRPLDPSAAVAARGWSPGVSGGLTLRLVDPELPANQGTYRLEVADGAGSLQRLPDDPDAPALHVRGWSLLWCGAARAAQVRTTGHLTGDPATDPMLDLLLAGGGRAGLLDYF